MKFKDATDGFHQRLETPASVYAGFDPTADSLHLGHLSGLVGLRKLQLQGHSPIVLAGGFTAMIGDPSGRSSERNLLSADEVAHNVFRIEPQLRMLLDFECENSARLVNNADWTNELTLLAFLRDIGKHFTVATMVNRDTVQSRLASGLSFTEFSYSLIQANDFLHLFNEFGCEIQVGGSDQWGNMAAGVSLIRRVTGATVHAATWNLITRSDGTKFGKTAGGDTVWLDSDQTSPFAMHQFLFNVADDEVSALLETLTLCGDEQINEALLVPQKAQELLADTIVEMVHGSDELRKTHHARAVLFNSSSDALESVAGIVPTVHASVDSTVTSVLIESGLCESKSAVARLLGSNGIAVNHQKTSSDVLPDSTCLVSRGKKNHVLVLR